TGKNKTLLNKGCQCLAIENCIPPIICAIPVINKCANTARQLITHKLAKDKMRRSRVKNLATKVMTTKVKAFIPKGASTKRSVKIPVAKANQMPHHVGWHMIQNSITSNMNNGRAPETA